MPKPSTTSLKLDGETKERVQRLASARRRSPHWVMREAIEQYVEREE
ncbi:MAG: ribbon-helix-helix domain-containing protein, partial [Terriglobales bacterium]